jgi:cyclopropane fatty-acyl-phospholipid synthase-like methyltransferase
MENTEIIKEVIAESKQEDVQSKLFPWATYADKVDVTFSIGWLEEFAQFIEGFRLKGYERIWDAYRKLQEDGIVAKTEETEEEKSPE